MHEADAPSAYREFLRTYLEAFEDLELVLELSRGDYRPATPAELAARLRLPGPQVFPAIERLTSAGLLQTVNGLVVLARLDARSAAGLAELRRVVDANRAQVMADMSTFAIERLRTGALRAFTRAFILKKDTDG